MATSRITKKQIVEETVTLNLSMEEAKTLFLVLGRVGGEPVYTRRGDVNNIRNELSKYVEPPRKWHVDSASLGRDRLHGFLEFADSSGPIGEDKYNAS